jgi:hypothetical protein
MSGKKSKYELERRRKDVAEEVARRSDEKVENVINEIAERLYLRPGTIWRDLKEGRESEKGV